MAKQVYIKVVSFCSKKRKLAEKYKKQDLKTLFEDEGSQARVTNYNLEYNDFLNNKDVLANEVLTDKEKQYKQTIEFHRYSKKFWSGLIFLSLTLVYTCIIIF